MDTATLAILISFVSLAVATFAVGWNVYRDVALKARVKVSILISSIFRTGVPGKQGPFVSIRVLNLGPGEITINTIWVWKCSLIERIVNRGESGVIPHDHNNPLSGQLPAKLAPGDNLHLLFPSNKECFLKDEYNRIGVIDSFGRFHWAQQKDINKVYERFKKDFGVEPKPLKPLKDLKKSTKT